MSSITLDNATIEKLKGVDAPSRYATGERLLASFILHPVFGKGEVPELSDEELTRRFNESIGSQPKRC